MFERFTDRARRVVVLAQEQARLLHHTYIGTEHLLLALIEETDSVAARTLQAGGITEPAVRAEIESLVGAGRPDEPGGSIPFSRDAKDALQLSLREALLVKSAEIAPEHLLLGLIRHGEGAGVAVLERLGVNLDTLRISVMEPLAEHIGGGGPGPGEPGRNPSRPSPPSASEPPAQPPPTEELPARLERLEAVLADVVRRLSALERRLG